MSDDETESCNDDTGDNSQCHQPAKGRSPLRIDIVAILNLGVINPGIDENELERNECKEVSIYIYIYI